MVLVRYLGLSNPRQSFAELKAYRTKLIDMGMTYRPFSDDYKAIHDAVDALDEVAKRFVGNNTVRDLYASTGGAGGGNSRAPSLAGLNWPTS